MYAGLLIKCYFLGRCEDVVVVVYEDFLGMCRDFCVEEAAVDAPVVVDIEEVDDGVSWHMLEAHVVEDDAVVFFWIEVVEIVNMAHH